MCKGELMRTLIKQFILLMFFISGILNFAAIPEPAIETIVNWTSSNQYGGYFSRPLIMGLKMIFGTSILAIKILTILWGIGTLVRFFYSLNVRLPSLPKINIEQYEKKEDPKKKIIKKEIEITNGPSKPSDDDLIEKVHIATTQPTDAKEKKKKEEKSEWGSLISDIFWGRKKPKIQTEPTPNPLRNVLTKNTPISEPEPERIAKKVQFAWDKPTFPYSLLENNLGKNTPVDQNFIVEKAKALQKKLIEFWIPVTIEGFDIGPSIVQIKIKPSEGVKISSIENLNNDIKLSLKSKSLRIVAPIPWTDNVGIQIPNPNPSMVKIGDILNSVEFQESMKKSETWLALGKGIDGKVLIKPLESMPHLLVAWATGSGKSVGINDFIVSLMFQNSPSDLKFLMVDPKQVELEMYSGLPYMLAPIVYDSTKAVKLLRWAVEEMERRYSILKEAKVRQLNEYNEKAEEKMYRIVFIIDEMADMMISSPANKKEAEDYINRLAAKSRAVWIHLILATQRPSVNVITGMIKANIPTRIAYGVVSDIDSRTIIGRKGAEDLVGKGDMLYIDPSTKNPIRIQSPFISTEEVEKVVNSLREKYMKDLTEEDVYNPEIIRALEDKPEMAWTSMGGGWDDDELVQQAIEIIMETRKASATMLQRKLGVGFARAARIMDILEEQGIIGPQEGAKPREIYV